MELFRTDQYYIFINGECGLWWDRTNGEFEAKTAWDLASADDPECLGVLHGIVGKIELCSVVESRLMLIRESDSVGDLPGGKTVYKIKSIALLQPGLASDTTDLGLKPCPKHQHCKKIGISSGGIFDVHQKVAFAKTWGTIKSATNTLKNTTQQAAALATSQVKLGKRKDSKDREKFERRILEELQRIFTETDSFYYCLNGDLTNTLQRQCDMKECNKDNDPNNGWWRTVDDRFFWNKHMLQDIISLNWVLITKDIDAPQTAINNDINFQLRSGIKMFRNSPMADPWIVPVIQGFVQIEHCKVEVGFEPGALVPRYETFTLSLISRRSRFRAGTRYKRRGVDEDGKCANYVETEQIVSYHHHQVSFVQVRGSVPVFWSQPGYKYRPPPRIDKGEEESQTAFEKHFADEISVYGPVCIVNLVDQTGKEKIIWDAYTNHVLAYNSIQVIYATFDFHEYCRGMHFENVSVLIASLVDVIRDMNYCWTDKEGQICNQKGIFRINCIDCLDRTNVVQTAIAKAVMEIQFSKLGLIPPEGIIPANIRNTFQLLWANNGDIISKQYAGTNALKGDYTRTGERKFTGMMKDGMNSANRFYLGHFVDSYRQASIDIMQGQTIDDEDLENCANELQTAFSIAQNLVPLSPPMYMPDIALGPEMKLINAVYHITRYYLSRFKDAYRQATIDMMLGNAVSEDVFSQERTDYDIDSAATAEHVKTVIEDCKKMLISDNEVILGAWGLIDADSVSGDPAETEMDMILILTRDSYYVAEYDDQLDRVTKYQQVQLVDLTMIEFGVPEHNSAVSLFKQSIKISHHCIRLHYQVASVPGYYHMFRSTNLRFFNNMAVGIKTDEEMIESLKAICEAFNVALEIAHLPEIPFRQGKLDKRKTKVLSTSGSSLLGPGSYLDVTSLPHMTRNVSETQLLTLKNVGTKALNNVTQQFSKLNKLGHSFNSRKLKEVTQDNAQEKSRSDLNTVGCMASRRHHKFFGRWCVFMALVAMLLYEEQGPMFTLGIPDGSSLDIGLTTAASKHSSDEDEEIISSYDLDHHQHASFLGRDEQTPLCLSAISHRVGIQSNDLYVSNVGIIMGTKVSDNVLDSGSRISVPFQHLQPSAAPLIDNVSLSRVVQNVSIHGHVLTHSRTDLSLDVSSHIPPHLSAEGLLSRNSSLSPSPHKGDSTTPEITIDSVGVNHDERSVIIAAFKANQKHPIGMGDSHLTNSQAVNKIDDSTSKSQELKSILTSVKLTPPNTLQLARKLSLSSDEVHRRQGGRVKDEKDNRRESGINVESSKNIHVDNSGQLLESQRSSSVRDLSLNITSSQSESAIKTIRSGITNVITSPAAATKELVLSPFSKFAKGMQNLGANLDPRKLKAGGGTSSLGRHTITEHQMEEHQKLREKWRNCKTRLIAL